ncbi:MAG TPA: ethanolamine utilization protein EutN [Syntrophomonas sp.]|jgi:ethanolamine utilization protein EutN|nr:ethanolamine utilization protein EutN [Syntrophomonas sp.]
MYAAKVIGHIVATKKDQRLVGWKLLIVSPLSLDGAVSGRMDVAVDIVGSGIGEIVLVVEGSSARLAINDTNSPVNAAIVGIVDSWEVGT